MKINSVASHLAHRKYFIMFHKLEEKHERTMYISWVRINQKAVRRSAKFTVRVCTHLCPFP